MQALRVIIGDDTISSGTTTNLSNRQGPVGRRNANLSIGTTAGVSGSGYVKPDNGSSIRTVQLSDGTRITFGAMKSSRNMEIA
jgi:hypothetical protein